MTVHGTLAIAGVPAAGTMLAAGAALGLVACGSVAATGAGHRAAAGPATARAATASAAAARASAGVPLCSAGRRLVQLEVRLTASQPREVLPRALTTTDAPRVRALASALCHLPPLPRGLHCPAEPRGALLLVFAEPGRFTTVRIQETGCANVTGLGPARQWSWSSPPGQLLAGTAGGQGKLVPDTHPGSG